MRRWIASLLAALMLANVFAWPSVVLAEVLEHDREAAQFDSRSPGERTGAAHCAHGCASHFSQHFQWQAPASPILLCVAFSEPVLSAPEPRFFKHVPALPFRPPLTSPIQA